MSCVTLNNDNQNSIAPKLNEPTPPNKMEIDRSHIPDSIQRPFKSALNIEYGDMQYLIHVNKETGESLRVLDCINNVQCVGHANRQLNKAVAQQLDKSILNMRYENPITLELTHKLIKSLNCKNLDKVFFTNSGSEANELALQIVRKKRNCQHVIAFRHAYHGHTAACFAVSTYKFDKDPTIDTSHTIIIDVPDVINGRHHVQVNLEGSNCFDVKEEDELRLGKLYADDVRKIIEEKYNEGIEIAAIIVETLQSCGGQIIPPKNYFKLIDEICKEYGILTIFDEVQVGFGRSGTFWAFSDYDIEPDVVTMAKSMGNGIPVGATVTSTKLSSLMSRNNSSYFNTYGGNPMSCAAALSVINIIYDQDYVTRSRITGNKFLHGLKSMATKYNSIILKNLMRDIPPLIGNVRGKGLFIGMEFIDGCKYIKENTYVPPNNKEDITDLIEFICHEHHVLLMIDGPHRNVIKIKPPLPFTEENVEMTIVAIFSSLLAKFTMSNE
ncbi:hypothetical protein SNEBB_000357 [Seison nebaliae]|nr:hypothetical protein SNEBB_000357 [Seison nebaliae]